MADYESLLNRWLSAGVLDPATAGKIRQWEQEQSKPAGLRWQGIVALILGALLLASGVILFVSAHWDQLGPFARLAVVLGMVTVFHLAGGMVRESFHGLSTALHAVGTASTGAAIALVGQIFNIEEHWPAAILLWALAALAGWLFLRDQAQQTIALLLVPAWIFCELEYYASGYIGQDVYLGRFLFVWAILYLTLFIGSKHRATAGLLFAASAIAAVVGTVLMLASWRSWSEQSFIPFQTRLWGWCAIAALPLLISLARLRRSTIVAAAVAYSLALPWCYRLATHTYNAWDGRHIEYTESLPNLLSHALVAAFTVFLIWWGVRHASRALVNYGMVGFAIAVGWFYFDNIFDKVGRSLGLIGMGVLFLAGGWGLERMRRRLISTMGRRVAEEAQ